MKHPFFYLALVGAILVAMELLDSASFPSPSDPERFGLTKTERKEINDCVDVILDEIKFETYNDFKNSFKQSFDAIIELKYKGRTQDLRDYVNGQITDKLKITRRDLKKKLSEKQKAELVNVVKEVFKEAAE